MIQQINLYQSDFQPQQNVFAASFILWSSGVLTVAMFLIYGFAWRGVEGAENELQRVTQQESIAMNRLENLKPYINAVEGKSSSAEQLEDALKNLRERQDALSLIEGVTVSETKGFSQHLQALAKQNIAGIWLTRVKLSSRQNQTRIEGRALRAELIPLYVQQLTANPPFAALRFSRFRIESPLEENDETLHFSLDSENLLSAAAGAKP